MKQAARIRVETLRDSEPLRSVEIDGESYFVVEDVRRLLGATHRQARLLFRRDTAACARFAVTKMVAMTVVNRAGIRQMCEAWGAELPGEVL
jgi:prophage antirepressor-like protein